LHQMSHKAQMGSQTRLAVKSKKTKKDDLIT